jgi:hypothetical protein
MASITRLFPKHALPVLSRKNTVSFYTHTHTHNIQYVLSVSQSFSSQSVRTRNDAQMGCIRVRKALQHRQHGNTKGQREGSQGDDPARYLILPRRCQLQEGSAEKSQTQDRQHRQEDPSGQIHVSSGANVSKADSGNSI